ncbi:MAG: helix-turn-helix domain-containing protein [Candidatus Aenigmatarchaeota archaeon]
MEKSEIIKVFRENNLDFINSLYSKCFDVLIKKGEEFYFVKIYKNLNSLTSEVCCDLANLESFFEVNSIILSLRTSRKTLGNHIYLRKNVRVLNLQTFLKFLENKEISIYRYGKVVINIDFQKMKKQRETLGYSLKTLAKKLDVSKKHIYEIEKGIRKPSYELALKLEKVLGTKLVCELERKIEEKETFNFLKFCSIKGIKKEGKKFIIPRKEDKALEESREMSNFLNVEIL